MTNRVILLAGPTASGKSSLAMDIAARTDGIVINADSMQVYEELRLLTARPTKADEAQVPHRLYGVLPAGQRCSVGKWLQLAKAEIARAHGLGKQPILVGGTGLYFAALTDGLAQIPEIPAAVRQEIAEQLAEAGPRAMHARLRALDPDMATRLNPNDPQRLSRALEVLHATGRSLLHWQSAANTLPGLQHPWLGLALVPERLELYDLCDARFNQMLAAGALEEVAGLMDLGLDPALPAMKALGVPELMAHLRGEISQETAIARAQTATRRYAKRQMTWINNKMIAWDKHMLKQSERNFDKIFANISEFLLTGRK